MIELEGLQLAGVYLILKERESNLDSCMRELADEIENYLYDRLSIEEMEELKRLYGKRDSNLDLKL